MTFVVVMENMLAAMKNRSLVVFGYETPLQLKNNKEHGWDDEESVAIFVMAGSKEQAEEWGREIAERFLKDLFKDQAISWKKSDYACWVVDDPASRFDEDGLKKVPLVEVGDYPALSVC